MSDKDIAEYRFKQMIERASTRRKRRERRERIAKNKSLAKLTSAIAACLTAVFGLYFTVNYLTGNNNAAPEIAAGPTKNPVKIELLTDSGTETIQAGRPIIAANTLKTLRINDNRRMILNIGAELSIIPHNLGCIVKLQKGEIYTEVEHDGKPFIVETTHGRAVITGTTFNIKADDKQMELAVAEGSVRFEGKKGKVNVTAGHQSLLALNRRPSLPLPCNTKQLTAWATGINESQEIVATTAYQTGFDLPLTFDSADIDLESIDYKSWIEQKRSWFKQEFPHIFKFKEALAKEGIEVDYPELLVKSGDLCRFAFPEETKTQLIPVNYESMVKLVSAYDRDSKWLCDNLMISRVEQSEADTSNLRDLNRWTKALEESLESGKQISGELLMQSLHASVYLSETKTLAWLAVSNNQIALSEVNKTKMLELLEGQIKTTNDLVGVFKQIFAENYSSSTCDEYKQRQLLVSSIENIEGIIKIERKLFENEIIY